MASGCSETMPSATCTAQRRNEDNIGLGWGKTRQQHSDNIDWGGEKNRQKHLDNIGLGGKTRRKHPDNIGLGWENPTETSRQHRTGVGKPAGNIQTTSDWGGKTRQKHPDNIGLGWEKRVLNS